MAKSIKLRNPITKEPFYPITLIKNVYSNDGTQTLLNGLYPVGSIYISTNSKSPADIFGGAWEQLPEGYALWTTKSGAGGTIEAGLPNIKGYIRFSKYGFSGSLDDYFGAITRLYEVVEGYLSQGVDTGIYRTRGLEFDASKSNSIYGKSTTVQPPAYKVYAWKRIS